MGKLLEALSSWKGPERTGEEIARRGLLVPQMYRREMVRYCCARGIDSDLNTYWSEYAKEYVFSGGRADPNRRLNLGDAPYRSGYLDQLAADQALLQPSRVPQLHPCLRRWVEEVEFERKAVGQTLFDEIESFKEEERLRHHILADGWTGKKAGVKQIFRRFAEKRGFVEQRIYQPFGFFSENKAGKAFCKKTESGLLFYCWVDAGGLPTASGRLPLQFFVSHVEDSFRPLGVGPDSIYVGAEYYARFKTPPTGVFGVFALVELFDVFYSTFS